MRYPWLLIIIAGCAGLIVSYFIHQHTEKLPSIVNPTIEISPIAHYPLTFVMQLKNDPQAGKKIFHEYCAVCHVTHPLIPVRAPRIGYSQDWAIYKKMGFKQLFKKASLGNGAMPARGGCFECTDAQLKQAINYLLRAS